MSVVQSGQLPSTDSSGSPVDIKLLVKTAPLWKIMADLQKMKVGDNLEEIVDVKGRLGGYNKKLIV